MKNTIIEFLKTRLITLDFFQYRYQVTSHMILWFTLLKTVFGFPICRSSTVSRVLKSVVPECVLDSLPVVSQVDDCPTALHPLCSYNSLWSCVVVFRSLCFMKSLSSPCRLWNTRFLAPSKGPVSRSSAKSLWNSGFQTTETCKELPKFTVTGQVSSHLY